MPEFAPEGGLPLALARGCAVAALLSAFGCLVFRSFVLPKVVARFAGAGGCDGRLLGLARRSLVAAVLLLALWLPLQAAAFAGAGPATGRALAAVPAVLTGTLFGHLLLGQLILVMAARAAMRRWPACGLVLTGAAVLLQTGHSHALSMYGGPSLLLLSDCLHLAAAGAWLGGLWPLLIVARHAEPRAGALAARWFSPLGKWCVAAMVLSAGYQFWVLIGGLPGLIGTAYGWVAGAKLALFLMLLAFAAANRYRFAPALVRPGTDTAKNVLVRSIAVQTGFGLLTVLAAGVLSGLPPSLHEQPFWPLEQRLSLVALSDPDLAAELWRGVLLLAAAVLLIVVPVAWRRLRRAGLVFASLLAAAFLVWTALPHLSLLLVEAYPTSYYTSPTEFAATSIVEGMALYPQHCATCHGPAGRGDGLAARSLPVPPADLTAAHLWEHSDGELFWWLTHGIEAPDGGLAMPGFAGVLSDDQRWALIDAIRARNAGTALRETHVWPGPVQLPGFDVACPGGVHRTTGELRGRVLYVVMQGGGEAPIPQVPDATLLVVMQGGTGTAASASCVASDPAAWGAMAVVTGGDPAALAGTRLLVDGEGWLRTVKSAPESAVWNDLSELKRAISDVVAHPLAAASGGGHHHH